GSVGSRQLLGLTRLRGEPAFQQMRRGTRVLARLELTRHALRDARGQALVVQLHGHRVAEQSRQVLGERARLARLRAVMPAQRQRQPDHDALHLALAHEPTQRAQSPPAAGARDGRDRRDDRAGRVAHGAAATRAAVVEGEHPHHSSSAEMISFSAAAIACSSLSGSRPPAWARVSRPPPPPPTISAAVLITAGALRPRWTSVGARLTTRCTRPSAAVPSTIAASPSLPLRRSNSCSSAAASGACTLLASTGTPSTFAAAASSDWRSIVTAAPPWWLVGAHLHHAHDIAVLLPEQGHRPKPPRLLERGHHRPHGIIAGDPLVDAILDVDQLLLAQRVTVAEVEAQLVGSHVGARLAHVTAETLAQGRLQQVRGGVIALGGVPRSVVHLRQHRLARAQLTGLHGHGQRLVIAKTEHVAHVRSTVAALAFERSRVGDLPSARRIERRLGQLDQV